ncbi:MAG TPA: hypothetical protein VK213_05935 [Bacteroidales bacterium]|nr:hypothetical protein [Bacteroidales bacterium]
MKDKVTLIGALIVLLVFPANAQNKLVINDRAEFLNNAVESALSDRLSADSITLSNLIDNRRRCEYWYATLVREKNNILVTVNDCNDKVAGSRDMGSVVVSATDAEKSTLLYFALSEILKNKYSQADNRPGSVQLKQEEQASQDTTDPGTHHSSRYFFSPSSMNLKKGEFYYNSLYFILHDVQYGISDQFSIGMGTTVFGFPFYITPKISIPVNERNSFAIGDMLMVGTWGSRFTGNLLYGTYTVGNFENNFTAGGGYLHIGGADVTDKINAVVLNFAGLVKLSDYMFLITENYLSPVRTRSVASYYNYVTYQNVVEESFPRKLFFIYGLTGFRFINKNKDLRCWQFGLSYFMTSYSQVPLRYSGTSWYIEKRGGTEFTAFPVVGYARKFSTR